MNQAEQKSKYTLVLSTCPDKACAERIAESLVTQRLAACVTILPQITSIYRWQGKIEKDSEVMMLIKTSTACYPALESALKQQHPYELPEILAVSVDEGSPDYLAWITTSLETIK